MDSGNSGSLQSSSGGDEDFDSRAESFSSFLNPTGHFAPPPPQRNPNSSMFDPLLNFFDPLSQSPLVNPNPLLNDSTTAWSKALRSDPICTGQINPSMASPSSGRPFLGSFANASPMDPFPPPAAAETTTPRPSQPSPAAAVTDHQTHVGRNPKKRSRASRRAPTTVLKTDTTNFRAMVQEFTGIPAPPFTSSPFPRSRLDLFGAPSSLRSNPSSFGSSQPPSYILRPFPQKFQPPPPPPPFVSSSALSSTTTTTAATSSPPNSTSISYHLPSDQLGLLNNMQNQILTFQTFLHSAPPKYPLSNSSPILRSKTQELLERNQSSEFGLDHTQIARLPNNNLLPSDGTISKNHNNNWGADRGVLGFNNNGNQSHLMGRSVSGNFDYSEKASENVSIRGDPPVMESWVCSSDP